MRTSVKKIFTFLKRFVTYQMVMFYLILNVVFTTVGAVAILTLLPQILFEEVWIGYVVLVLSYVMILMNAAVYLLIKLGLLTGMIEIKV